MIALAGEPFLAIGEIAGRAASARILTRRAALARRHRKDRRRVDRDRGRTELRSRLRVVAGAPPPPARRARPRRADARGSAGRGGRAGAGARRSFAWARAPAVDAKRSSSGATGSCFCAAPKARRGPTFRTRRLPPIPAGSRRSSSARRSSTRSAPTTSRTRSTRRCPGTLARRLDDEAPTHFQAPTGTAAPIDYEAEGGPAIALRVQELFGLNEHPSLAGGRIPLTLQLAFARPSPDPDHARPAGLLARLLGRRPRRPSRPLSPPFLARGPGRRRADRASEAEGNVRGEDAR